MQGSVVTKDENDSGMMGERMFHQIQKINKEKVNIKRTT